MRHHRRWLPALLLALTAPAGCVNCRPARPECTSAYQPCDRCGVAPARSNFPPVTLGPSGPVASPPGIAAPSAPLPPGPATLPPHVPATPPPEGSTQTPTWKPATPEPDPGSSVRLYPPERLKPVPADPRDPVTPPINIPQQRPEEPPPQKPQEKPAPPAPSPSAFPVDIPQFVSVKEQIASGQKPRPDGFAWLKDRGYRTVLYLKAAGEDDAAARRLVEGKGLTYQSLEVSPEAIKQGLPEKFEQALVTRDNLPLFVYDRDGSLAGPLWYLHLRTTDRLSREKALEELTRLGINPDEEGPQKDLWLAVQNYLSAGQGSSRAR